MLMRSGMQNHIWMIARQDRSHPKFVGDIGNKRNNVDVRERASNLSLDLKQCELGALEQEEFRGSNHRYLADQFRTYRSACPCHQNRTISQKDFKTFLIQCHWFTPQKIFDLHIADSTYLDVSLEDFVQARYHPDLHRDAFTDIKNASKICSRGLRDRNSYVINFKFTNEFREIL